MPVLSNVLAHVTNQLWNLGRVRWLVINTLNLNCTVSEMTGTPINLIDR